MLYNCIKKYSDELNFALIAWVILPDHFHLLFDSNESNLSDILHRIKLSFSSQYRKLKNLRSGNIWQHRFWDHIIRNQEDFNNHINYIHYNPVKHGITTDPKKWEHSSFLDYYSNGFYSEDWGVVDKMIFLGDYGE